MAISLPEQLKEARRELALRRKCYPGWVTTGRLTEGQAAYGLAAQAAIVETLTRLVDDDTQPSLFGTSD